MIPLGIKDWLEDNLGRILFDYIGDNVDQFQTWIADGVKDAFGSSWELILSIPARLSTITTNLISFKGILDDVQSFVLNFPTRVFSVFQTFVDFTLDLVGSIVTGATTWLNQSINSVPDALLLILPIVGVCIIGIYGYAIFFSVKLYEKLPLVG